MVCLISLFFTSEAFARLLDAEASRRLLLTDLLEINTSRYFEGYAHSRFPAAERKLHIPPYVYHDPLDVIYARTQTHRYVVQPDDSLKKIARAHSTTVEFMKLLNRIKGSFLKPGQKLQIPAKAFTIEINKTLNRLYLKAGDVLIKEYPVSTGRSAAQTPLGIFIIQSRYPYPTWFHKGTIVSSASSENYLGSRWLGFDKPQFGIHGTIFPELIGQSVSKGCVRMKNEDVEEIFEFIPIGTLVIITK
jgi:LysM repeat protein